MFLVFSVPYSRVNCQVGLGLDPLEVGGSPEGTVIKVLREIIIKVIREIFIKVLREIIVKVLGEIIIKVLRETAMKVLREIIIKLLREIRGSYSSAQLNK